MKIKCLIFMVMVYLVGASPLHAQNQLTFATVQDSANSKINEKVVREAYARLGYDIEVVWLPGVRALEMANNGEVDGELGRVAGIELRWTSLIMVPTMVNVLEGAVFTKNIEFEVAGWDSLRPYSIGVRRGIQFSDQGTQGMRRQIVNSNQDLFNILRVDRVELIIVSLANGLKQLENIKYTVIKPLKPVIEAYPLHHYLHNKHRDLLPKIDAVLQAMEEEGVIQRIRQQVLDNLQSDSHL